MLLGAAQGMLLGGWQQFAHSYDGDGDMHMYALELNS
jgi:hypothetical protein